MKKLLPIVLTVAISAGFLKDNGEAARIHDLNTLAKKLDIKNLKVNEADFIVKSATYAQEHNITTPKSKLNAQITKTMNNEFVFNELPFRYRAYLANTMMNMPPKSRLDLVKSLILERGDWYIVQKMFDKAMKKECDIVNAKYAKEAAKAKKNHSYLPPKKPCALEKMTIADKKRFEDKVFKEVIKYYYLRFLYLTRKMNKSDLQNLIAFYRSPQWQKFIREQIKLTGGIIFPSKKKVTVSQKKTDKKKTPPKKKFQDPVTKDLNLKLL